MEPKFSQSDVVIVKQQADAESGDVVIACNLWLIFYYFIHLFLLSLSKQKRRKNY